MTQRMNMLHNIFAISVFMVVTIALVPGCTSEPKKVSFPSTANANEELTRLGEELNQARQNQIAVLAPRNFEKAQKHYEKAQKSFEKDRDQDDVLSSVGMAKAYLLHAQDHAEKMRPSALEILQARDEALGAGAAQFLPRKMARADNSFKEAAYDAEKSRSSLNADKRADLQRNYLDLQVESLKVAHLKSVENSIDIAKKNGARRHAPRTLASVESKLELAENVIETDRNNSSAIRDASAAARREASKLLNVTHIAKTQKTSESVALELNAQRMAAQRMNEEMTQAEALLLEERQALQQERETIATMKAENEELERKNQFNQTLAWAQEQFGPNEAEVYRQGDKLLIRLKGMNYNPGQAELPSRAYPTLNKVKEVIARVGAEQVRVEGHTDSLGSEILNQTLSKSRAENVANFLADQQVVSKSQIEAEGLGYEKPISNNSTPQGRAQNRRVDIIVTPSQNDAANSSVTE